MTEDSTLWYGGKTSRYLSHTNGFIVGASSPTPVSSRKGSFAPLKARTAAPPAPSPRGSQPREGCGKVVGRGLQPLPIGVAPRKPARIGRRQGPQQSLRCGLAATRLDTVSGFTALMDRFSLTCKSERDMDKLAHIFSYYISDIVEHSFQFQTKPSKTQEAFSSECCRTEEEFLDQVKRKLAQTSPEKDLLTTKPCHCKDILKLVLSPLTQHCLVIGETTCAFYYLLEAAAASLDLSDNYMRPSFI
ncbi:uncharacterized protein LOC116459791 [Hylobates moloch]|uniref:uncharacterized protein LOC116459791 n=1 Tax=Hylobates moloch TaxID=81572 RepID=UPI0026761307|nr:uncharacterized protein LOC116459791 [Hylobates moloch]